MKRKSTGIAVGAALLAIAMSTAVANAAVGDPLDFAASDVGAAGDRALVLGTVNGGDFGLSKLLADGSQDPAFGAGGLARTDFGGADQAVALALRGDGMAVAAGNTDVGGGTSAAVARYNADGTPDTSFSGDGKATVALDPGEVVSDVAIDSTGRVAMSIDMPAGPGSNFKVIVLTAAGSPDAAFNGGGGEQANVGGDDSATTVGFQSDGKLIVAGRQGNPTATNDNYAVFCWDTDGQQDPSFHGGAPAVIDYAGANQPDGATALAIDSSDRIVVTGNTGTGGTTGGTIRLSAAGALDTGFGGGGAVDFIGTYSGFFDHREATDVAIGPSGEIAVYGVYTESQSVAQLQLLDSGGVEDFRSTDTGDNTVGGGTFSYDLPIPTGVAFDSGGAMFIAGQATEEPTGIPGSYAQRWTAGAPPIPDTAFGGDGTIFLRLTEQPPRGIATTPPPTKKKCKKKKKKRHAAAAKKKCKKKKKKKK